MAPKTKISREQAMEAKPLAVPVVRSEPLPDGGKRMTVRYKPTGIQKWLLRTKTDLSRRYDLDSMGVEVLAMCDGQKTVRWITQAFAKRHRVNEHEAQQAVATFLRMMIRKGLVVVAVDKESL